MAIGGTLAALIGTTGAAIIGGALLLGGLLLVTGASTGAILRRTGHVMKRAGSGAKRAFEWPSSESQTAEDVEDARPAPVAVQHRAARRGRGLSRRGRTDASLGGELARSRGAGAGARERRVGVRDVVRAHGVPPAGSRPAPHVARGSHHEERREREDRRPPRAHALGVRCRGDRHGPDLRPARHALRAAARAGHEGVEGRRAQGRPQLRARDDGDPHPRADPRQAGRGRRGAEPLAEARHPRRHLRRPPCDGEPAVRVARQGHLRQRDLDRSRAHAAPPHRRHDRLGQVGLHQHDPHLDAPALDAGRGADDPHRPEAHRARLLRVDPAPPDAGRLESRRKRPSCS